ncbi:UPF0271 protein [Frankineae bacterium MT45]|nr:UPF0271 protein [Frankineae bacterium MT45]
MAIDVNADLGEGFGVWQLGDDLGLLPHLSSANVACGFHAGDPVIMQRVCVAAADAGVSIGAQVGYRDLIGFGRRRIDVSPSDLTAEIIYQTGALQAFATSAGSRVRYLKPHGALYNTAAVDPVQAAAIVDAAVLLGGELPLLGLPNSELARAARQRGVRFIAEAFADRGYLGNGQLVPRGTAGAVIDDEAEVVRRGVRIATEQLVTAVDGTEIEVNADSLCLHGDTSGAVSLAEALRAGLEAAGVEVTSFAVAR